MTAEIIELDVVTTHDLPAERILRKALGQDLEGAVVVGFDKAGDFYFASSYADGGDVLWLLKIAERKLIDIAVGASSDG